MDFPRSGSRAETADLGLDVSRHACFGGASLPFRTLTHAVMYKAEASHKCFNPIVLATFVVSLVVPYKLSTYSSLIYCVHVAQVQ